MAVQESDLAKVFKYSVFGEMLKQDLVSIINRNIYRRSTIYQKLENVRKEYFYTNLPKTRRHRIIIQHALNRLLNTVRNRV